MDKEIKERFEHLEEEIKFTRELLISPSSNKQGLIQDVRELEHLYTVDIGKGVKQKLEALEAKIDIDTEHHVQDLEGNMSTIMEKVAALEVQNKGLKIYTEGLETNIHGINTILENHQEGYKRLEAVLLKFFNENIEYLKGASGFVDADERIIMYGKLISDLVALRQWMILNPLYFQKTCRNFDPKNCGGCKWCSMFICKGCGKNICECEIPPLLKLEEMEEFIKSLDNPDPELLSNLPIIYDILKRNHSLLYRLGIKKDSAGNSVNTNSKSSELVPKVGITASNNAKTGSIPADPNAERTIEEISLDFKMKRFTPELAADLIIKGVRIGQTAAKSEVRCTKCNEIILDTDELFCSCCTLTIEAHEELLKQTKIEFALQLRTILKKRGAIIDDPSYPDGDQNFKGWLKQIESDIGG